MIFWPPSTVIFASVYSDVWKVEVVDPMEALVQSCVVLPCKFNYPGKPLPDARVRGIWHVSSNRQHRVYDEDPTQIADSFKDRTRLIGRLGEKNCSLEINQVKDHDNGPFCFRAEIPNQDKYSFLEKCVTVNMKREFGFKIDKVSIFLCVGFLQIRILKMNINKLLQLKKFGDCY